ncbi:unnamed protein product [Paramecium octaurelia]|uniref:Uncharacterized protein n=1 Tax=Paramecium octaurelia TaxID=43137 RepID=A0A8S1YJ07_PAROT|nr:unnamed protein product [Paramecium octaurelia]
MNLKYINATLRNQIGYTLRSLQSKFFGTMSSHQTMGRTQKPNQNGSQKTGTLKNEISSHTKCEAIVQASMGDLFITSMRKLQTMPAKTPIKADYQILTSSTIAKIATILATQPLNKATNLNLRVYQQYKKKLVRTENLYATIVLTAITPQLYCSNFPYELAPLTNIKIAIVKIKDPYLIQI